MRNKVCLVFVLVTLLGALAAGPAQASYVTVNAFSLTTTAQYGPDLLLPKMNRGQGMTLLPFYLALNFANTGNMNWGIELFSDNLSRLTGTAKSTPDGLYRGLRGFTDPSISLPLYWQSYPADLRVGSTWGTPASITNSAGGLGFSMATLRYWGTIFDKSDVDRTPTWDADRGDRVVANVNGVGNYPFTGRKTLSDFVYVYFAADLRNASTQSYVGELVLDFFNYPFDFNTGCYVTPNPVRPVRGQQAYFNFFTNSPNSKIIIKIYDPTGNPIVTLQDTRYWNCRNANGGFVEGGLYIYQLQVEGHFISGTVVVIK